MALGMAEYRSGNDAAAELALLAAAKAGPYNPHVTGISAFYRAMSLFRQGKNDEARKLAIAAAAKMKPAAQGREQPAGRSHGASGWRRHTRISDHVAGLQRSEGLDQVRRGPRRSDNARREMTAAKEVALCWQSMPETSARFGNIRICCRK